jgi:hypothetical protein
LLFDLNFKGDGVEILFNHEEFELGFELFVGGEFYPNVYLGLLLDVADDGGELEVAAEEGSLGDFEAHGEVAGVRDGEFLAVDIVEEADLEVVEFLLNGDGNFDAFAFKFDGDGG